METCITRYLVLIAGNGAAFLAICQHAYDNIGIARAVPEVGQLLFVPLVGIVIAYLALHVKNFWVGLLCEAVSGTAFLAVTISLALGVAQAH